MNLGKKEIFIRFMWQENIFFNTYICCADHYFVSNQFLEDNAENRSYRAVSYQAGKFREFEIACSDAEVITDD